MKFYTKQLFAIALSLSIAGSAIARGDADFTLVNATGYPIHQLFVSPSKTSEWGKDHLGEKTLPNGSSRSLRFGDSAHCLQDMMVVFEDDGSKVTWENINLCELEKVTLKYNRSTGAVTAVGE